MTWGGAQGFQTPIEPESFTVDGFGVFGHTHTERKLTCTYHVSLIALLDVDTDYYCEDVEFFYSGHMTPRGLTAFSANF